VPVLHTLHLKINSRKSRQRQTNYTGLSYFSGSQRGENRSVKVYAKFYLYNVIQATLKAESLRSFLDKSGKKKERLKRLCSHGRFKRFFLKKVVLTKLKESASVVAPHRGKVSMATQYDVLSRVKE